MLNFERQVAIRVTAIEQQTNEHRDEKWKDKKTYWMAFQWNNLKIQQKRRIDRMRIACGNSGGIVALVRVANSEYRMATEWESEISGNVNGNSSATTAQQQPQCTFEKCIKCYLKFKYLFSCGSVFIFHSIHFCGLRLNCFSIICLPLAISIVLSHFRLYYWLGIASKHSQFSRFFNKQFSLDGL